MSLVVKISDVMGITLLVIAVVVTVCINRYDRSRLSDESAELIAGASVLIAILGTIFVFAE